MALPTQLDIPLEDCEALDALHFWANALGEERGEIFTRVEVVEFILDLSGWKIGENLCEKRLLEPSCGTGDFLIPAIRRLLEDSPEAKAEELRTCIFGVEVNKLAFEQLRARVQVELEPHFRSDETEMLLEAWLHHADFLTLPFANTFTHVVGNPPYLRLEALPKPLMQRYRALFTTMYDRADLYIAFFEKGLQLLEPEGKLGYICANRWTKNRYGGPLRELIAGQFHMDVYVDFTGIDAFHGEVSAYPAVTIIRRGRGDRTLLIEKEDVCMDKLDALAREVVSPEHSQCVHRVSDYSNKDAPWLLSQKSSVTILQGLAERLPLLEAAGCKVGIGVATGADAVFIGTDEALDVEPSRKLPLLKRKDLRKNEIHWEGNYVLNPFDDQSTGLVDPEKFPRFKSYIERHRDQIVKRHVARKNPGSWFKTIDRIYPELLKQPKLVIPDIQGEPQVAYDSGNYYPHHNLYFITSEQWDLRMLQKILISRIAKAFVSAYSVRMRGDSLRYQAQNLRKIRLPLWSGVPEHIKEGLVDADAEQADLLICELYGLSDREWDLLLS